MHCFKHVQEILIYFEFGQHRQKRLEHYDPLALIEVSSTYLYQKDIITPRKPCVHVLLTLLMAFINSTYRSLANDTTFHQHICKPSISKLLSNGSKEGTDGVKRANLHNQSL